MTRQREMKRSKFNASFCFVQGELLFIHPVFENNSPLCVCFALTIWRTHLTGVAHSRAEHRQHVFSQCGEDRRGQQEVVGGKGGVIGGGVVGGVGALMVVMVGIVVVVVKSGRKRRRRRVCGIRIHIHIQIRKRVCDGGARRSGKLNGERWHAVSV